MPSLAFLAPAISLALGLIPVFLLRRKAYPRAQDYFVSSGHTPPGVIQNSSIAYALKMAAFGPFFAWGASGDFWPAIIASAFFGLGSYLLYVLRRPMLEFLGSALSSDRSITISAFIAQRHGNDPRVRLLASGLTAFALTGLVVCETIGVATVLKPVLSGNAGFSYLFIFVVLAFMVLCTIPSGNSGAMYSAQLQLGMLYFGLFGATAFLLYLQVSDLRSMPPHTTLAIVFVTAFCAVIPIYRRTRFVDRNLITQPPSNTGDAARDSLGARVLSRLQRILNVCITVLAALVVVVALMELSADGPSAIVRDSAAALRAATRVPDIGLVALILLPLFYPIVDMTNWQRIAAFEKDRDASLDESTRWSAAFRRFCMLYAAESPFAWLFMCAFGAIVVVSAAPGDTDVMQAFIAELISQQNEVATTALSLLLVGVLAMALSTMSALFSASLCTFRYDILPILWPEPPSGGGPAFEGATATRRTIAAGGGLCLVILLASYLIGEPLGITFTSGKFLALVFAFSCAQLAFVPLVLGPLISRTRAGVGVERFGAGGFGAVSPGWALGILGIGAAMGVGAVTVYLATGHEPWLWAAVPACLAAGALLFAIARLQASRAA
jgi:hypothetical protein